MTGPPKKSGSRWRAHPHRIAQREVIRADGANSDFADLVDRASPGAGSLAGGKGLVFERAIDAPYPRGQMPLKLHNGATPTAGITAADELGVR